TAVGADLIEIHGQHGSLRLLEPATQTGFLDRFAGPEHAATVGMYVETYRRLEAGRRALRSLEADGRDREREMDRLRYQVDEIRSVDPQPGETHALQAEEARLSHAERLLELAGAAEEVLGGDGGIADGASSVAHGLAAVADLDPAVAGLRDRA